MQVRFPRPPECAPDRTALLARLAALAGVLGLVLALALPVLAAPRAQEATPVAGSPADLLGVYTVAIGKPDVPTRLAGGPALLGLWTVTFNGDGSYEVARQDVGVVASGTYEVEGSTLTFNDWTGIIGCGTPAEPDSAASYAWERDGDTLTLTPITDGCEDRRILFSTRTFGSFAACATQPLEALVMRVGTPVPGATPVPAATPVASIPSVAIQEGVAQGATPEEAIDELLRQATGCWATQDPARFLPLHTEKVFADLAEIGPLPEVANLMRTFMSTPVSFERIGRLNRIDDTRVWAYVEITIGGEPLPQRLDFALVNGTWLLDTFFLAPAEGEAVPTEEAALPEETPPADDE